MILSFLRVRRRVILTGLAASVALILECGFSNAFGQIVEVPTLNPNVVRLELNRSRREVTLYRGALRVGIYPVAVGRSGWETPSGEFRIFQIRKNPSWRHPLTGEIFGPGDPQNELGHYWIGFGSNDGGLIGFHDTPHPETVGKPVSHGCVRMFEKDIARLFREVRMGTVVTVLP